jgi:pimeloyl-ACP methyl ester carboxylesterase
MADIANKPTILLIHGAFTTAADWKPVISHLDQSYHILAPDLPGHGTAGGRFTLDNAADTLYTLIKESTVGNKAHVVGHSLGAQVAIRLAEKYPSVVDHMVVSGFEIYPSLPSSDRLSYILWTMNRVENLVPRPAIRWLMDGTDIGRLSPSLELCRQVADNMKTASYPTAWPAPTLIIAAGRGGLVPSYDHPEDAKKVAEIGRQRNDHTLAVTHPLMRHPWNRQDPLLFANTVRGWVGGDYSVPVGFARL